YSLAAGATGHSPAASAAEAARAGYGRGRRSPKVCRLSQEPFRNRRRWRAERNRSNAPRRLIMANLGLILLVFGFVFAVIAGCFQTTFGRFHFGWCAIAFWIASELIGGLGRVFH